MFFFTYIHSDLFRFHALKCAFKHIIHLLKLNSNIGQKLLLYTPI